MVQGTGRTIARPDSIVLRSPPMQRRIASALAAVVLLAGCAGEPAIVRLAQKEALVHALRSELLASVEAEKSAVLATTDEESAAFADESRRRSAEMQRLREELHRLVATDGRPGEIEKLAAFDAAWKELREVDERLLVLAVANSNLKAARLAAGDGALAVDRLVDALAELEETAVDPETLRALSAASVAALRIQTLLAPHVASPEDAEMTRLEERMRILGEQVDRVLATIPPGAAQPAWAEYRRHTAEVIRLSRLNTNVVSFDVSVHEKRRATEACVRALATLLGEIQAGPHATR
jgi:hypothetical protein